MTTPLHGLVYDMPEHEYHARPELSSTGVRNLLDSPAKYQWEKAHRTESKAFDIGRAVHTKILGAGSDAVVYPDEFITASGWVSTRPAAKAWEATQRADGLTPLTPNDYDKVDAMAEAVLAHKEARRLLELPGQSEVSAFAKDPETGVKVRARFDRLTEDGRGLDVKTTSGSASAVGFGKTAAKYGYPVQEGHYGDTLEFITGERVPMLFLVVEKNAPPPRRRPRLRRRNPPGRPRTRTQGTPHLRRMLGNRRMARIWERRHRDANTELVVLADRRRRDGDRAVTPAKVSSVEERFWSKVDKTDTCWLWTAGKDSRGDYGQFRLRGRLVAAHRLAYELMIGPIPQGMSLDHTCHVKHCVNPAHLRVATHKQNLENRQGAQTNNKSSGTRGVSWHKDRRKWVVYARHGGARIYGGIFADMAEAEAAAVALRNRLFTHNDQDRSQS